MSNANKEQEALKELEAILDETRPKNLLTGILSGTGYIVGGGLGAVGIAVLGPVKGATDGALNSGVLGGVTGLLGGTVVGFMQAVNVAGGGVVQGVSQVVRGVVNTPEAITAPSQGKWWNENDGRWTLTDLNQERKWLKMQPEDNDDILGDIRKAWKDPSENNDEKEVKDAYYYDLLEVSPSADESTIKRQYYVLARRYSPDRAGQSEDAKTKFREIGTAYVVLSNHDFRERYDKYGVDFMYVDDEIAALEDRKPMVDPMVMYRMLFGSDKFVEYIGTLAAATSASVGDDPRVTKAQARLLQKRRVTRLALLLAERLKDYTEDKVAIAKAYWKTEAEYLTKASYGTELTNTIGKAYSIAAAQFLGSLESGIGMPGISQWAKAQIASIEKYGGAGAVKASRFAGDSDIISVKNKIESSEYVNKSPEEQAELLKEFQKTVRVNFLRSTWITTVVDITNTLHETAQMVLHDQSVDMEVRRKRGEGLKILGDIFSMQPRPEGPNFAMDGQLAYEETAFAAMLETAVRKEQVTRKAQEIIDQEAGSGDQD